VRKSSWVALFVTLVAVAAAAPVGAAADSVEERLARARADQAQARAAASDAEEVLAEYERIRQELSLAVRDVLLASRAQRDLEHDLALAQEVLDERARTAYELGPAFPLELLLGSRTQADFASIQEYVSHTVEVDEATVHDVEAGRASLDHLAARLDRRRNDLAAAELRLRSLAAQAIVDLADAEVADREVEKLERELEEAQAEVAAQLASLVDATRGFDQSELLALLGPDEGRGCDIPKGLEDTGQRVEGLSSWYGWEFAGQHTASGAIFDPTLFTVANKELPLNVFLRIHFKGKCAIALLNDRGPYGGGRVFDASEAVADYLGYLGAGVVWVEADVLVPK
jgi:hypothetical protein